MKLLAKIIVWIMAAPLVVILLVLGFPLGIIFIQAGTDWLDGVPVEIVVIAAAGAELAWILFVIAPFTYNSLVGGS